MNLEAIAELERRHAGLGLIFVESGGDNLAAAFSPELVDVSIYVIDVAGGDKIPRKGGPGITRSDLLVINKIDLAPACGGIASGSWTAMPERCVATGHFSSRTSEGMWA